MDLRSLRYFVAVVEAGSLTRAAGTLYIAQPALTAQIKKLESALETQLFERTHAGVIPTAAGLELYQDARRLLSDAAALKDRISRQPHELAGSVTIAAPFLLTSLLAGRLIARVRQSHPRIRLFFIDDLSLMVVKAMVDRRADIGILVDTQHVEGLDCTPLAQECIYFCGYDASRAVTPDLKAAPSKARGDRPDIEFRHAAKLPLVMQSKRFTIRRTVEEAAHAKGITLNIEHEHDSARVIRSLYLSGAGFTFTPACALSESPTQGKGWFAARVVNPLLTRSYSVALPARAASRPAVDAVCTALQDEIESLIHSGKWIAQRLYQPPRHSR